MKEKNLKLIFLSQLFIKNKKKYRFKKRNLFNKKKTNILLNNKKKIKNQCLIKYKKKIKTMDKNNKNYYKTFNKKNLLRWKTKTLHLKKKIIVITIKTLFLIIFKLYKPIYNLNKVFIKKNKKKEKKKYRFKKIKKKPEFLQKKLKQYLVPLKLFSWLIKKNNCLEKEINGILVEKKSKLLALLDLFNETIFLNKRFEWKKLLSKISIYIYIYVIHRK